jgi:ABC-type branched-subunit amino acid transport system substrate-binding protein
MWQAAQAAVEQANRAGGHGGKPFRLLPAWAQDPWGGGVKQLAQMVYDQHVWAIVSGVDGPTAHLAEQVAAKARLPVINAVSTDKTVNLANVPWIFSLAPGDHLIGPPLAAEIVRQTGPGHFSLVSANDHDSRELVRQLRKDLLPLHSAASWQFQFDHGAPDLGQLASEVIRAQPRVVVVVADADDSASMVVNLRQHGFDGTVIGGPALGSRRFLQKAGDTAVGVVFPRLVGPSEKDTGDLLRLALVPRADQSVSINSESSLAHDYTTLLAGDAVRLLIEAIHQGDLNRARIRDALVDMSPWRGHAGTVRWDKLGRNVREVQLGRYAP